MARGTLFPLILTILPLLPILFSLTNTLPIPGTHGPRKIALLHMYNGVHFFARLGNLTGENKARYARRHGYDIVYSTPLLTSGILKNVHCKREHSKIIVGPDPIGKCWGQDVDFQIDHSRAPTFGKIKLALAACRGRDNGWLLWTDADAMIINQTIALENVIDDGYDVILAYDWLMLNAGMLFLKCSDWTKHFLSNVYNARKFDQARALDQSSFQEHIDKMSKAERNKHIKIVPKHAMNVYVEEYRPGDFLLHMAGKLYEATEPGLYAIANQFDILSMIDDIEDIEAFFRGKHLLNYYSGTCKVEAGQRQRDCQPSDPRRILLNESLGSMSYPNRYRHVGLRYYWLGNWKDAYDKPGWDVKLRPLPYLPKPANAEMPPPPPLILQHDAFPVNVGTQNVAGQQNGDDSDALRRARPPEKHRLDVDVNSEVQRVFQEMRRHKGTQFTAGRTNTDLEEEDDYNDGWPMYVWLLILSLIMGMVSACAYALKRRRMKNSKIQ